MSMTVFTESLDPAAGSARVEDYLRYVAERTEYAFSVYDKKIRELEARIKELEEQNV